MSHIGESYATLAYELYTKEYENWFSLQNEDDKIIINARVLILSEFGPDLGTIQILWRKKCEMQLK